MKRTVTYLSISLFLIIHFQIFKLFFMVSEIYFIYFPTTHLSNLSAFVQHEDK